MKYYYFVSYYFYRTTTQQPGVGNGEILRHHEISSMKDISEITAAILEEGHKNDSTIRDVCIMNYQLLRKSIK